MSAIRTIPIAAVVPWDEALTEYDRAHMKLYLRLIDAEDSGATLAEMAQVLFEIDAEAEPERARLAVESHLARARWMTEVGYRLLLLERDE